jgi:hypothetical protein
LLPRAHPTRAPELRRPGSECPLRRRRRRRLITRDPPDLERTDVQVSEMTERPGNRRRPLSASR